MELSGNIRDNLRRLKICFNENAVVVLTSFNIPIQLKIVASFGKTFNYYQSLDDSTAIDTLVCMNKIIMNCESFNERFFVNYHLADIKKQVMDGSLVNSEPTAAQSYILELLSQADEFLRKNRNIIVLSSDKGGKTVIMDREEYVKKMNAYLDENIDTGNYEKIDTEDLSSIQRIIERAGHTQIQFLLSILSYCWMVL